MANNDITVKEALITHALVEIEDLVGKLDEVHGRVYTLVDSLDSYFEEIGRDTANSVKKGIEYDINKAHDRLTNVHKELSDTIEIQRKLNVQLNSIAKKIQGADNKYQSLMMFGAAFLGGLIPAICIFLLK